MEKQRLKVFFSDGWGSGDYTVRQVVMLESSGKILGANYGKMILDRKHFKGHLNAAGKYAECRFLNSLELLNQVWWGVGEPNQSCIQEKRSDKGYIGDKDDFLLFPCGMISIRDEAWLTIDLTWALKLKRGSKVTAICGMSFQEEAGVVQSDSRMSARLCKLRDEGSDDKFWSRYG